MSQRPEIALRALSLAGTLSRVADRIAGRLDGLEERLQAADETAWTPYLETVTALVTLLPQLAPERRGALLTTAEMAARLQVQPKTLLKRQDAAGPAGEAHPRGDPREAGDLRQGRADVPRRRGRQDSGGAEDQLLNVRQAWIKLPLRAR